MSDLKEAPEAHATLATLILTLDVTTKDFKIVGNIVNNREACMGMLIQALYMVHNEPEGMKRITQ